MKNRHATKTAIRRLAVCATLALLGSNMLITTVIAGPPPGPPPGPHHPGPPPPAFHPVGPPPGHHHPGPPGGPFFPGPGIGPPILPGPPPPVFHPIRLHPPGFILPILPPEHLLITLAAGTFYFHAGNFYRPAPGGYVVIEAPIGATITALPPGFTTVNVRGVTYYSYGGIYYVQSPNGYVVVEKPVAQATPPATTVVAVVITNVPTLNVRSGPSQSAAIVTTLPMGTEVKVLASQEGWYFVQLADGLQGWLLARFTNPQPAQPQG